MAKKFKSARELADYMGVDPGTITRWLDTGLPYDMVGRQYEFKLNEVIRYLMDKSSRHRRMVDRLKGRGK